MTDYKTSIGNAIAAVKPRVDFTRRDGTYPNWVKLVDAAVESVQLRDEIASLRAQLSACGDQIRDLNAENERLRGECQEWNDELDARVAEGLAAANALLAAPRTTWSHEHWADWDRERAAHLAAQPATAQTHTEADGLWVSTNPQFNSRNGF